MSKFDGMMPISGRINEILESIPSSNDSVKEINERLYQECDWEIDNENSQYILAELEKKESFNKEDLGAFTRIMAAGVLQVYAEALSNHLKVHSLFPPP